jgi:hypothetical protein
MSFSITGYVLEKPRVGSANSAFTVTPDNLISDAFAYGTAYPTSEVNPRTDYLVFVVDQGDLPVATFAWTKNEVVQRFDYSGKDQRFVPLPGAPPTTVGSISPTVNSTRIKVAPPVTPTVEYPIRVAVTSVGAGITLTATTVVADSSFTTPSSMPPLSCEISRATGNMNFSADVVSTYNGQVVRYQQQSFFALRVSNGKIGSVGDFLILNPIPGIGAGSAYQIPLVRIGFGPYLTAIAVPDDASFGSSPPSGSFKWSASSGTVRLSPADITSFAGKPVYYDGSCYQYGISMRRDAAGTVGTISAPLTLTNMPPAGGDLIFRIPSVGYQFPEVVRVDVGSFDSIGKKGQVQTDKLGNVQFSAADQALYGSATFEVIRGDLPIDHGISLRLFRTPIDPSGSDPSNSDVTAIVSAIDAVFMDPVIGSPTVFLPAVPRDDGTLTVKVTQGTGTFTSTSLPRLDVPSPPAGTGYTIDFDQRQIQFALRRNNQLIQVPTATGSVQLPDALVQMTNLVIEHETGTSTGLYTTLTQNVDYLIDGLSGVLQFIQSFGSVLMQSSSGVLSGTTFTDASADFVAAGVSPGDLVNITAAPSTGVFTVSAVVSSTQLTVTPSGTSGTGLTYEVRHGEDILADRFFKPLSTVDPATKVERVRGFRDGSGVLVPVSNSPRLSIAVSEVSRTRFRFGTTTFSTSVVLVANDGAFSSPSSLPSGTIEISEATGHLNFSSLDVGGPSVYAVLQLVESVDYRIKPVTGFIQTTDRMLAFDEMLVTYTSNDGGSTATIVERATFLVRKEPSGAHPTPTTVLTFNPTGRTVASIPGPSVFRGGRPQVLGRTCVVDTSASTIRFLDDGTVTNAIAHGPIVQPSERVAIDYFVYEALGGENTTTVLRPPMNFAQVVINQGDTTFTLPKDRTADLPVDFLLRFESEEVYRIVASSYASSTDTTTITVGSPFRTSATSPNLFVSSGPCTTAQFFVVEAATLSPVARGMNRVVLAGDRTPAYPTNTILQFSDGASIEELYLVSGATYDSDRDQTTIVITSTSAREYKTSTFTVRRSIRPFFDVGTKSVQTSTSPILTQPSLVFRQVVGLPGQVLSATQYKLDDGGRLTLTTPLAANEFVAALYTGYKTLSAGPRIRASYTALIAPNSSNGLLGQVLKADYTVFSPDTFYWRVETMTNFRGEVADQLQQDAKASVPTSGPILSNASSPKLFQQGRESIYYRAGRLANEDIIGRGFLKFFNDNINLLEDVLGDIDGRVIGDQDGRFKFDGNVNNPTRTSFAAVTNQIDDVLKISDDPRLVAFPPFPPVFTSIGTFTQVYKANPFSRFYSTARNRFGITTGGTDTGANTGDPVLDIGTKALRTVQNLRRRIPRGQLTQKALTGDTTLNVDNANGTPTLLRPPFENGMKVIVTGQDGTPYVTDGSPLTVTSVGATTLGVSALPVDVPAGATVYLVPSDTTYDPFQYRVGLDVGVDLDNGKLLFNKNSIPFFPTKEVSSGQFLQMDVTCTPQGTDPEKIPALFGGTTDDDGDVAVPMIGPSYDREVSHLSDEQGSFTSIAAITTPTFVSTGSLDPTKTIITNISGPFPSPVPKVNDLVRILDGLNGTTTYRPITAVTANTITVGFPFTAVDSGFHYTVTVSNDLVTSTAAFLSSTSIQDLSVDFVAAGVRIGHTVVLTSGPAVGERRQISTVATHVLTLAAPFTSTAPATYRVATSLATFSDIGPLTGTNTSELALLRDNDPLITPGIKTSEKLAIERFLDAVFTDVLSPTSQTGTVSGSTLTGTTTFQTSGVNTSDYVYIRSGSSGGIYPISAVNSETQLTVSVPFPVAGSVTYRIVSSFSVGRVALGDLYCILAAVDAFIADTVNFQATTAAVPVNLSSLLVDSNAYANGILSSGFGTTIASRTTSTTNRLAALNDLTGGPLPKITNVVSGGDRLYDVRFTWIQHRVKLDKGLIVLQSREVDNQIKALGDQTQALTKLAAVTPRTSPLTPEESTYSSTCS